MSRFAIRRLDRPDLVTLGNLIKADDYHVIAEAREATARLEEQGRLAYAKAVAQGRADGLAEGRQAAGQLLTETAAAAKGFWIASERRLVEIVTDAVRRIVGEIDSTEATAAMVARLLGEVRDEGKIRLHVSPGQRRVIEKRILDGRDPPEGTGAIEVIEDAGIENDACRLETELGVVETGLEAQVDALRLALEACVAVDGFVRE